MKYVVLAALMLCAPMFAVAQTLEVPGVGAMLAIPLENLTIDLRLRKLAFPLLGEEVTITVPSWPSWLGFPKSRVNATDAESITIKIGAFKSVATSIVDAGLDREKGILTLKKKDGSTLEVPVAKAVEEFKNYLRVLLTSLREAGEEDQSPDGG